ncbi:hypothetical protein CI109_105456 [Kwoniella shandongensis]|uniref:Uncharacterized protein n=1 Tax=Kwoniella shandongensis TaxID=1734106 RepID=A0A5M6C720_9TREE|nr:uncharacterized protein CI109_002177 [Kwoniella shandongensis]KAA5529285.1 hypothetical protein CI109_002177 [Kwoniella shandongensis]
MPGLKPTQEDVEQFVAITQASHEDALHFLEAGTTLEGAIEEFYAAQTAAAPGQPTHNDEDDDDAIDDFIDQDTTMAEDRSQQPPATGGVRNLNGELVNDTLPAGWGKPQKREGRIRESNDDEDDGHGHGGDDDEPEEFYAGGQSGLAVQNPDAAPRQGNSIVDNILRMAGRNAPAPPSAGQARAQGSSSAFGGAGHTLGSDDAPSSEVPAAGGAPAPPAGGPSISAVTPNIMDQLLAGLRGGAGAGAAGTGAQHGDDDEDDDDEDDGTVQTRRLTFWRNGFSIEDGPLMPYEDPQNQRLLQAIEAGRAPPSVFGVNYNQRLNVEVAQRRKEEYQAPPKKPMKAFEGSGNRLGSLTPEVQGSPVPMPGGLPQGILVGGSSSSGAATPTASGPNKFEVDESKPTTNVQLRLGDGTRLVAKVNLTHTVADLRSYVSAARPSSRAFVLQTTFPSRELSDLSETIEGAKLQNAVVVQRFT